MAALCLASGWSCEAESDGEGRTRISDFVDNDGDGYTEAQGDCNDENRFHHPGALDPCDGIDQNCDGRADEQFDVDGDGWTSCGGDCRDHDPHSYPGHHDAVDGIDNDCDGIADNNNNQYDDDGDGYSEDQGDCNDDRSLGGALIGPEALEIRFTEDGEPERRDNDCDGLIDEEPDPCVLPENSPESARFAQSLGLCNELIRSSLHDELGTQPESRRILSRYGDTYRPREGRDFVVLSSGIAGDKEHPDYDGVQSGTGFDHDVPHPDPAGPIGCSSSDPSKVNDYVEFEMWLKVPANALAFSFDFNFMSAEFPEFVCTSFDDTFLALLESEAYTGNISFDAQGNRMSINVGFFDVCEREDGDECEGDEELNGTGYERGTGGGTGWLTTTAPVVPGEKIRLRFIIFDEGDHIYDSAVIIDNFRWVFRKVDGPGTVE